MLQSVFYIVGIVFFVAADALITIGIYIEWQRHKKASEVEALQVDIMGLLARVRDEATRKKATEFFAKAKDIETLRQVKARLVEILTTGGQND